MSPPPPAQDAASALKAQNRRSASGSASPRPPGDGAKGQKMASNPAAVAAAAAVKQTSPMPGVNVHYTLLIRLPFARGDFEDPPQVEWDAGKDKRLWKIISKNSRSADIDWAQHAQDFGVTQPFLLQQAAWLYERHFQHVKAQMTKLRTTNAPTPVQGAAPTGQQTPTVGGVPMKRLGSGGGAASRAPSSLSIRSRDSPVPRGEAAPGTPSVRPELSRTPSAATVTQSRHFLPPSSPRQPAQRSFRGTAAAASSRRNEATPLPVADEAAPSPPASSSSASSSSDSEADEPPTRQSQLFRRPPPFQRQKKTPLSNVDDVGEDDSGDDSPTFLPFASKADGGPASRRREDPSATLRDAIAASNTPPRTRAHPSTLPTQAQGPSRTAVAATPRGKGKQPTQARLESSASSNSSAALPSSSSATTPAEGPPSSSAAAAAQHRRLEALSPRHRAELARLSPRRTASAGQGSDGTPSMGSSFSDLDDTSITQSALEEALASNLRHGGASRLSTISHAFGSRLYGRGGGGGGGTQGQG